MGRVREKERGEGEEGSSPKRLFGEVSFLVLNVEKEEEGEGLDEKGTFLPFLYSRNLGIGRRKGGEKRRPVLGRGARPSFLITTTSLI